jgi:hypothetical protein
MKMPARNQTFKDLVDDARSFGISPQEVRQIQSVIKSHRFPSDVQAVEVNFGRDWVGSPAAWIEFLVEDDLKPSKEKISRLSKFSAAIRDALIETHPTYWPYVNFRATP